jgi:hypothetical protein
MRISVIITAIALGWSSSWGGSAVEKAPLTAAPRQPVRAVSLRMLQQHLAGYASQGAVPESLRILGGLTQLDGFVIDRSRNDIVLFGPSAAAAAALQLDDFAVALRAARAGAAVPGCSIDPDSLAVKRLVQTVTTIFAPSYSGTEDERRCLWEAACSQPHHVRVLGVPPHSNFARTMVDADYEMKRMVDGCDSALPHGMQSLTQLRLNQAERQFKRGMAQTESAGVSMSRFWFYPGQIRFAYDSSIVRLARCEVRLITEKQYIGHSGNYRDGGMRDALAGQFAMSFTDQFDTIAAQKPLYRKLQGLFRLVALAKALQYTSAPQQAGLDLSYLIERYRPARVQVDSLLPGRSNYPIAEFTRQVAKGEERLLVRLPSCGGVSIDIAVSKSNFERTQSIRALAQRILAQRPSDRLVFWQAIANN